jgi:LacI family transcriptional regulator
MIQQAFAQRIGQTFASFPVGGAQLTPHVLARSLRRGQTKTIGLTVPDISPFFAEIARIVEGVGLQSGHSVILCNSDGNLEKEAACINVLVAKAGRP